MWKLLRSCIQTVCGLVLALSISEVHGNWCGTAMLLNCPNIFEAIEAEQLGDIKRLIKRGGNIEKRNEEGYTPLLFAVYKAVSEDVILTLLNHGANLEARDVRGNTSLLLACNQKYFRLGDCYYFADEKRSDYLIPIFLSYGSNIEAKNNDGYTALMKCIDSNWITAVESLLAANADVNVTDKSGVTPLMVAALRGNLMIIQMLLECGADISSELCQPVVITSWKNTDFFMGRFSKCQKKEGETIFPPGSTALDFAEVFGGIAAVKLILESGGNQHSEMDQKLEELKKRLRTL